MTSTEGAYFAGSSYHRVRERETISPILKRQNIDVLLDTTKIVRMTSDSIAIRHLMWLGRGDNTIHTPGHAPIIAGLLQNIQELKDHEQELIESRELAEVFRTIADIIEQKILPSDWRNTGPAEVVPSEVAS